jgi:hypothetical protein
MARIVLKNRMAIVKSRQPIGRRKNKIIAFDFDIAQNRRP